MANQGHSLHTLSFRSLKRSHDLFESNHGAIPQPEIFENEVLDKVKTLDQYGVLSNNNSTVNVPCTDLSLINRELVINKSRTLPFPEPKMKLTSQNNEENNQEFNTQLIVPKKAKTIPKPDWHAPWKLCRVVSGHTGWVRCVSFSPDNDYFMTGSDDRMLKIWDTQTGKLRLSLTGHVSGVRGVKISNRHPYAFSCGEDKTVKCWDLEQNKVVRHYHGHTSAVYTIDMHPDLDLLMTGGRDSVVRVWDMRTKINVHVLSGHRDAVASVKCQSTLPEIISGSHDATVRLWDLRAAKTQSVLTNHKKAVRSVYIHPVTDHFMSGSADGIKQFSLPEGQFMQNMKGHNTIINAVTVNGHNVAVSGGNDGTLYFWDWKSGYNFQKLQSPPQAGSLDSENSILGLSFDVTNQRLVTVEGDKTIKFYKEDLDATEESHPISWRPNVARKNLF